MQSSNNAEHSLSGSPAPTAQAILNILQQISISPPDSSGGAAISIPMTGTSTAIASTTGTTPRPSGRSTLQHLHSFPKSLIPKRRLSSSSSFDGISVAGTGDKSNKRQLLYMRSQKLQGVRSLASPLSRSHFIRRLNTFSVLDWTVSSSKLSPLVCAAQGWKCHPVRKNELHCTSCHSGIMVKLPEDPGLDTGLASASSASASSSSPAAASLSKVFNNLHHTDDYNQVLNNTDRYELPFQFQMLDDEFDEDDDIHVYETLVNSYVSRLSSDHYPTCTFLPLLPISPKEQNYYITPKDIPREVYKFWHRLATMKRNKDRLIGKNFRRFFLSHDEALFLLEYLRETSRDDASIDIDIDIGADADVNSAYSTDLAVNPSLDVILPALLGWELKIQKFHQEKFLLLNCECCTRRILLSTSNIDTVQDVEELSACPHRAEIPVREQPTEFDGSIRPSYGAGGFALGDEDDDEEEDMIDLEQEHDTWCCMRQGWRVVLEGLRSSSDVDMNRVCSKPSSASSPAPSPASSASSAATDLYNTSMRHLRAL